MRFTLRTTIAAGAGLAFCIASSLCAVRAAGFDLPPWRGSAADADGTGLAAAALSEVCSVPVQLPHRNVVQARPVHDLFATDSVGAAQ